MKDRDATLDRVVHVAVADPELLMRDVLSRALSSVPDIQVVATIAGVSGAEALLGIHRPDVVIVSDSAPGQCLAMVRFLADRYENGRILVLSRAENEEILFAALVAGARGFVSERASLRELTESLRRLVRENLAVPPVMLSKVIDRLIVRRNRQDGAIDLLSTLTSREREVVLLLTRGGNNDSIARALYISPQTARTHVQNIMAKLGTRSRLATVSFVMQEGRLELLEKDALARSVLDGAETDSRP
jgi:DNA-binding NarL/FixJ family response regulator